MMCTQETGSSSRLQAANMELYLGHHNLVVEQCFANLKRSGFNCSLPKLWRAASSLDCVDHWTNVVVQGSSLCHLLSQMAGF